MDCVSGISYGGASSSLSCSLSSSSAFPRRDMASILAESHWGADTLFHDMLLNGGGADGGLVEASLAMVTKNTRQASVLS